MIILVFPQLNSEDVSPPIGEISLLLVVSVFFVGVILEVKFNRVCGLLT